VKNSGQKRVDVDNTNSVKFVVTDRRRAASDSSVITRPSPAAQKASRVENDYCQHFVDTSERPQNFIRDADPKERFKE